LRHQTQVEMENQFLHEKLAAAEKEKEKELIALYEKQKQEQLVAEKLLELEKQEVELEKQKMELEKQKNAQISSQLAPGNSRVSETGSSIGSHDQTEEISEKIIFQGKIISDADKQLEMQQVAANKLFLQDKIISSQVGSLQSENKINSELLLDTLMSDNVDVDVHPFTADILYSLTLDDVHDVVHSLTVADVYTRPQLTDSLGAQHAWLPVCATTTTTTTTQPGQPPLLMINDTQPPLPSNIYSQPVPALTTAHQLDISVHQLTASVHQPATGVHQAAAPVYQQSAATVYTQPACTQPSATQLLYTQPSTTWSVHTQPTHPQPLTAWTATALPLGTQPPQPSVSAYTADVAVLSDVGQPSWMSPVGVHPAQPGLMHSLDVRPVCTQPPLPQPLHMQMPGAQPAYTQSTASRTLSTYTVGTQPVSQQGSSPLYNRYVGGAGHVALDPHVRHLGQTQTLSVSHSPFGDVNSVNRPVGTGSYPRPDIGNGLELLSQAANAVARLPLDNWVNVGPTPHTTQLSGSGLPGPSQLLANNYWVDSVSSANLYQSAHEPPVGGIPRVDSVPDGQVTPGCRFAWLRCGGVHGWSTHKLNSPKFIYSCAYRRSTQLASALGTPTSGVPLESGTWVIRQRPCTPIGDTSPKFFFYSWWRCSERTVCCPSCHN